MILQIFEIIKWPLAVIIVFLIFKRPILNYLKTLKKFSFDGAGIKVSSEQSNVQQVENTSLLANVTKIFRKETFDLFRGFVRNETNYDKLLTDHEKFKTLLHYSTVFYILREFDLIYSNIFGSQIALLQLFASKGPQTFEVFETYFNFAQDKAQGALKTMTKETYPKFLYSFGLILNNQDQMVDISILGIDFLKYLTDSKKDFFKEF